MIKMTSLYQATVRSPMTQWLRWRHEIYCRWSGRTWECSLLLSTLEEPNNCGIKRECVWEREGSIKLNVNMRKGRDNILALSLLIRCQLINYPHVLLLDIVCSIVTLHCIHCHLFHVTVSIVSIETIVS